MEVLQCLIFFAVFVQTTLCDDEPCSHGAYLTDPANCASFYQCVWGRPIHMSCPDGLHFNPSLSVCDWPQNAGCEQPDVEGSGDTNPPSTEEGRFEDGLDFSKCNNAKHGDLTSDSLDCNHYYHCVWGRNIRRPCPKGLHFNPVLKVCDWPYQAQCKVNILHEEA